MNVENDPLRAAPVAFVRLLIDRWRIVVVTPLVCVAVTLLVSYLRDPLFTSTTTFMPESDSSPTLPAGFASLAGQIGINLPTSGSSESPEFYANLARSQGLLTGMLYEEFATRGSTNGRTLLELLEIEAPDSARLEERALVKFRDKMLSTAVNRETSLVTLVVQSEDPLLSAGVANGLVERINRFNLDQRQSRARAKREFIAHRLQSAQSELHDAESLVRAFLEANRSWQSSPELTFEKERLDRNVSIKQDVFLTLSREAEVVAIEAVDDTPVITVIDVAMPPATQSAPRPMRSAAIALIAGVALGVILAATTSYFGAASYTADA